MITWNFVLFLISLMLWATSIFLVGEAAKSQQRALGESGNKHEQYSGVAMSQLLSFLFIFLWVARGYLLSQPPQNPSHFLTNLVVKPEQLTPGLLLGTFPPLIVGVVKLVTALGVTRGELENAVEKRNRLWVTWAFFALHLIVAIAAANILIRYFF